MTLDSAMPTAPAPRTSPVFCPIHRFLSRNPQAGCADCRAQYESSLRKTSRCNGVAKVVDQPEIVSRSPFFVAKTVCPDCGKRVNATRPTKRLPWYLVGTHD